MLTFRIYSISMIIGFFVFSAISTAQMGPPAYSDTYSYSEYVTVIGRLTKSPAEYTRIYDDIITSTLPKLVNTIVQEQDPVDKQAMLDLFLAFDIPSSTALANKIISLVPLSSNTQVQTYVATFINSTDLELRYATIPFYLSRGEYSKVKNLINESGKYYYLNMYDNINDIEADLDTMMVDADNTEHKLDLALLLERIGRSQPLQLLCDDIVSVYGSDGSKREDRALIFALNHMFRTQNFSCASDIQSYAGAERRIVRHTAIRVLGGFAFLNDTGALAALQAIKSDMSLPSDSRILAESYLQGLE